MLLRRISSCGRYLNWNLGVWVGLGRLVSVENWIGGRERSQVEEERSGGMAMPWGLAVYIINMVWTVLEDWISSCVTVADDIAQALRTGDVGPFPIG